MTINLGENYAEFAKMQERLAELHFHPDPQGQSICSYIYKDISIDIMPAEDTGIGISNTWYKPGFDHLQQITLDNNLVINILPAPYFLATKIEAFKDRGNNDFYGSHDYEDIIYVLDNRTTIVEEILTSNAEVKNYLKQELSLIAGHPQSTEILAMHIHPLVVEDRFPILLEKIKLIVQ